MATVGIEAAKERGVMNFLFFFSKCPSLRKRKKKKKKRVYVTDQM